MDVLNDTDRAVLAPLAGVAAAFCLVTLALVALALAVARARDARVWNMTSTHHLHSRATSHAKGCDISEQDQE